MATSPEYKAWMNMRSRCNNPATPYYVNYGERGISVCERWLNSFSAFYSDMGDRPSSKHSVGRRDNDGIYEPGNCKWETTEEQQHNTRMRSTNTSGVRGVSWHTTIKRYVAKIGVDGKDQYIGCYRDLPSAARARKDAELKYWNKEVTP